MAKADPNPMEGDSHVPFPSTRWSVVTLAGDTRSQEALPALSKLCSAYWYPLYSFARRNRKSPHDAQDLVQGFFEDLLQRNWLQKVGRENGRFRSFMITCFRNYCENTRREQNAARRKPSGGWAELEDAEGRFQFEPADTATPDQAFERTWGIATLGRVLEQLRSEYAAGKREHVFNALQSQLSEGRTDAGFHKETAKALGMSEGAVRTAVSRLRDRFGLLLRQEIESLVASPLEIDDELRHMLAACGRNPTEAGPAL